LRQRVQRAEQDEQQEEVPHGALQVIGSQDHVVGFLRSCRCSLRWMRARTMLVFSS